MAEFAIVSPKLGVGEHVPKVLLDDAFIQNESRHIRRRRGVYEKIRGRLAALEDANGVQIACPQYVYAVTNVDVGQKTFTIAGNHASVIAAPLRINGSTGNDGLYTLVSATDVGAETEIVVSETPASAVSDGNVFVGTTPVLKYHLHIKEESLVEYLLLATAYHILLWSNSAKTLTVKFTCLTPGDVEHWSIVSFQDQVYATNGSDYVQVWDVHTSASTDFTPVGSASGITVATGVLLSTAKFVYAYQGYLFLGYTCEDGTWLPRRIRSCDADDPTVWDEDLDGDQGHKDLTDLEGFVNGFSEWSIYLIIACTKRMMRGWLTTDDSVFRWERETIELGCLAPDSLIRDRAGRLFFIASDLTIRELSSMQAIYKPVEETTKNLNRSVIHQARAMFNEDIDRILWAVPTATSETNDLVIEYDSIEGDFYFHDVAVSAFGIYSRQSDVTWDQLPYDAWTDWDWPRWDWASAAEGNPLPLCADYSGQTFEWEKSWTDAGNSVTGILVFGTSFGGRLHGYKRASLGFDLVFQRDVDASDVDVYARRDTEQTWTSLGTVSLGDSDNPETVWVHVSSDLRFRHLTLRLDGDGAWQFLGCYFPSISDDGLR